MIFHLYEDHSLLSIVKLRESILKELILRVKHDVPLDMTQKYLSRMTFSDSHDF